MGGDFESESLSEPPDSPFGGGVVGEEGEGAVGYNAGGFSVLYRSKMMDSQAKATSPCGSNQFSLGTLLDYLLRGYLIAIEHPK